MNRAQIRQYFRMLGQKGGQTRSAAKAAAARENGRKGGRPRGTPDRAFLEVGLTPPRRQT